MKDLRSELHSKPEPGAAGKLPPGVPQEILNQYGGKSNSELMEHLRRELASGNMSAQELIKFADRISPALDDGAREALAGIVSGLVGE